MADDTLTELLSYARSQLARQRQPLHVRAVWEAVDASETMARSRMLHPEPTFEERLCACVSKELYGEVQELWDKGARGEVLWERIVAILTPLADEGVRVVNAPSASESLLPTWKLIAQVFNQGAELPLTVRQLKLANKDKGGPIEVQKGRGKRPSVTKSALLEWRAKIFSNLPLTRDDDGHAAAPKEVVFRQNDQVGQTKRNMRSTGRQPRMPKNAIG